MKAFRIGKDREIPPGGGTLFVRWGAARREPEALQQVQKRVPLCGVIPEAILAVTPGHDPLVNGRIRLVVYAPAVVRRNRVVAEYSHP